MIECWTCIPTVLVLRVQPMRKRLSPHECTKTPVCPRDFRGNSPLPFKSFYLNLWGQSFTHEKRMANNELSWEQGRAVPVRRQTLSLPKVNFSCLHATWSVKFFCGGTGGLEPGLLLDLSPKRAINWHITTPSGLQPSILSKNKWESELRKQEWNDICSLQTEEPFYFFWDTPQCGFIQQEVKKKISNVVVTVCHRCTWGTNGYTAFTAAMCMDIYPAFTLTRRGRHSLLLKDLGM